MHSGYQKTPPEVHRQPWLDMVGRLTMSACAGQCMSGGSTFLKQPGGDASGSNLKKHNIVTSPLARCPPIVTNYFTSGRTV